MVSRSRNTTAPDEFLDSKWNDLRKRCLIEREDHKPSPRLYRDLSLPFLRAIYHDKCAYCERSRGMELEVDHYRPSKPRIHKIDIKYNQPGYYWLTYEWSNLLPLCSRCNKAKSNKFPLMVWSEENRINSHVPINPQTFEDISDLQKLNNIENPFLLHPEVALKLPSHFKFLNNGLVKGRTNQGKETILLLKLNRSDLVRERMQILMSLAEQLNFCMHQFAKQRQKERLKGALSLIFTGLVKSTHKDSPWSMYYTFIYNYFEYYLSSYMISNQIAYKIFDYFEEFKKAKKLV